MNSHAPHAADGGISRNPHADTRTSDTARAWGDSEPRAKTLGKIVSRGAPNPWLQALRARAQETVRRRVDVEGASAFSRLIGASRALVLKWLDPTEVDQHPIPLALLWAVDDDEFESLYVAIRADRRALREGR